MSALEQVNKSRLSILKILDDASSHFVERDELFRVATLGLITSVPVLFCGSPGTAKSKSLNALVDRINLNGNTNLNN